MTRTVGSRTTLKLLLIALLAIVAYLPTLSQPFIEDDYPIISLSRSYGPISGWTRMARDDVNRVRATTFVLTYWIEKLFGLRPQAFYSICILLHILNCWLIYAMGRWNVIGYGVSGWASAFFAIHEGHQEAVMWYAAANELLLFLFGASALLFWLCFLNRKRWYLYVAALICFGLALLSKESALILIPVMALPAIFHDPDAAYALRDPVNSEGRVTLTLIRRRLMYLVPLTLIGVGYGFLILKTRGHSFRFHDGSFVLTAPFWETWLKSFFALLLPWGWISILSLLLWRRYAQLLLVSLIWISISLVPYMFVDYVHLIPSRQTYLASVGLALIVGAAVSELIRVRATRFIVASVLVIVVAHNVSYLWLVKRKQYLERAKPTEQLISFTRNANGPVFVRCFPRPPIIGNAAVEVMLGKPSGTLVWDEGEARRESVVASFCYEPH